MGHRRVILATLLAAAACADPETTQSPATRTVQVRVVDGKGQVVTEGYPSVWWSEPGLDHGTSVSAKGGTTVLHDVPPRPVVIVALPNGFRVPSEGWPRIVVARRTNEVDVVLDIGATRTLTVAGWKMGSLGTVRLASPTDLEPSHHGVEKDGTIELEGLRPGVRYNLYVREDDTDRCALLRDLSADEPWPRIELGPGHLITGRIVYPDGGDWSSVAFMVGKTALMDAQHNENGAFTFTAVPPGVWTVVAYVTHEGRYHAATAEARAGGAPIVLDLRK